MSTEDEVRKTREAVERLENARVRLSGEVMRGDPKALGEDRQLERRIRELSRWIMRAEQQAEEEREKGRPKKEPPS